jgi:hypothetical protein
MNGNGTFQGIFYCKGIQVFSIYRKRDFQAVRIMGLSPHCTADDSFRGSGINPIGVPVFFTPEYP